MFFALGYFFSMLQDEVKNALGKAPGMKELRKALELEYFEPYIVKGAHVNNQTVMAFLQTRDTKVVA